LVGTSWYDLNRDGRRLEKLIKEMSTKANNVDWENEHAVSIYLSYVDRIIKASALKVNVAETVLQIKQILAEARKNLPAPRIEVADPAK